MTRRNKNIILSAIIIVLVVCLGLTFYFGREKESFINSMPNFYRYNSAVKNEKKTDSKSANRKKEELKDALTEDEFQEEETNDNEDSKKEALTNKKCVGEKCIPNNNFKIRNNRTNYSTKTVVLISVETFLLGAAVMYLVVNNLDKEEKKAKKSK